MQAEQLPGKRKVIDENWHMTGPGWDPVLQMSSDSREEREIFQSPIPKMQVKNDVKYEWIWNLWFELQAWL